MCIRDRFKLTRSFYEKDYRGIELVGDFKLTRKHYIAAETVSYTHLNEILITRY